MSFPHKKARRLTAKSNCHIFTRLPWTGYPKGTDGSRSPAQVKARAVVRPAARATPTYILQLLGGANKTQRLTKNERGFCGEMETGMEKTREQIENILEWATLDQLKIILRFLRNIIK